MTNTTKKKFIVLFMLIVISVSSCQGSSESQDEQQLRYEIGQMLIIGFGGFKQDDDGKVLWDDKDGTQFSENSVIARHIAKNHIGGVILFQKPFRDIKTGAFIHDRNIQNPAQVAKLNQDLQSYNKQMGNKNFLFLSVDQEGGRIDRLPAPQGFPVATLLPQAFGAKEEIATDKSKAIKETYEYAKKLAQEISDAGFNLNFAPVADVNINPTCPIIGGLGRSFSSDPKVVIDQAKQFIKAFNEYKIIPVLKHFPGHGSSSSDSHLGLVDVTDTYQKEMELQPYWHIIAEGYDGMIMTTHIINGQIDQTQCKIGSETDHSTWCPGTMSEKTLTNLLREQMHFKGLIISDDMTMGAIAQEYDIRESFKKAIDAGVDILIVANNYEDQTDKIIDTIAQLVKDGEIERKKIDEAYNRIVDFKKKHLMYQNDSGDLLSKVEL
jgi:beta-N-acetylhexosaminidase